jgi:hypothetical protein
VKGEPGLAAPMPPEAKKRIGDCDVLVIGTVLAFVPDAERVRDAFARHEPDRVALGVPPEDLEALERLRSDAAAREELVEPDVATEAMLKLLGRFGATRIPSPDLEAAYGLAKDAGIPLVALDLDDATHSAEYVKRVKVRHLWWHPRREKRLLAETFDEATDAYDLARRFDAKATKSRPLRDMERLREEVMAQAIRAAAVQSKRLLAVVPASRFEGITSRL